MKLTSAKRIQVALLAVFVFVLLGVGIPQFAQNRRSGPRVITGLNDVVFSFRFSPDSRTLAIARGASDSAQRYGQVELWDSETGTLRRIIKGFDGPVWSISFAPDGKTLVTGSSEYRSEKIQEKPLKRAGKVVAELKWWDAQTGDLKKELELPGEDRLGVIASHSPDGRLLAILEYYSTVFIFPGSAPFEVGNRPTGFTPTIFGRTSDADLKLIDSQTGELRHKLKEGLVSDTTIFGGRFRGGFPDPSSFAGIGQRSQRTAFSADGQFVAVWTPSDIRLWDTRTGEEARKLKNFKGRLRAVAFSPDGRSLAAATSTFSKDDQLSEIQFYDLANGTLTTTVKVRAKVISSMAFGLNGRDLLIGGWQRDPDRAAAVLELANMQTGSLGIVPTGDDGTVTSLQFSPNGRALALQSDASTIKLFDTGTWKVKHTFDENSDGVSPKSNTRFVLSVKRVLALAFSTDGKTVAGEVEQEGIKLWDPRTGEVKKQLADQEDTASLVEISANGNSAAEVHDNDTIRLWNIASGDKTRIAKTGDAVSAIALSPDGQTLAIGYPNRIDLLDTSTRKTIRTLAGFQTEVNCITFAADGQTLAAAEDTIIHIWGVAGGQLRRTIVSFGKVTALRFAPGGRTLAGASENGLLSLWDQQTGVQIGQLKKHKAAVNAIAFSPNGELMATGGDDQTVIIWEMASGKPRRTLKGHDLTVTSLAFSPDESLLASGSGNASVVLWDVKTGKLNRVLK